MKKLIALMMSLLMLVSLMACGSKKDEDKYVEVDLQNFFQTQYDALYPVDAEGYSTGPALGNITEMPEMVESFYPGLSAIETKQCMIMMPMMTGVPYELVLIELTDKANVEAVKTILQARVDAEISNQMAYPMITENWTNNTKIVDNGPYVMMIVSADGQSWVDAFNALFA